MGNAGIIKIPEFTSLTDGVINSIKELHNFTIAYNFHYSNHTNLILMHKHLPNRLVINISHSPQKYSILLQKKVIFTDKIEEYRSIREIKVEGDNDLLSIQQDIKNIIKNRDRTLNHQYFPF